MTTDLQALIEYIKPKEIFIFKSVIFNQGLITCWNQTNQKYLMFVDLKLEEIRIYDDAQTAADISLLDHDYNTPPITFSLDQLDQAIEYIKRNA